MTREGWCWLIISAALWTTGLYKGVNLVTLLGTLMLTAWGFNIALAGRRLRRIRLRRWQEVPVFAQTPFTVWVEAVNPWRKAQIGSHLEDRGPSHSMAWLVPRLDPGQRIQYCHKLALPSRGRYAWEPLSARTSYPFGLAERKITVGSVEELVVFPHLGRLHRGRLRRILAYVSPTLGSAQRRPVRHPAAQSDFHGLRAFRSGDSPHWIHWRTSARRGELMVREFEEAPTDNLVLILDPFFSPVSAPCPLLEEAISLTATICWEWCRQTGDRFVLAVAGDPPAVIDGFTGRDLGVRMLERLALETGTSNTDPAKLVDRLKPVLPYAPILLVSTRSNGLEAELERAFHQSIARLDVSNPKEIDFFER